MKKVFISYSHDSKEHSARVLALANRLRKDGLDCVLDQYELNPAEGWPKWMDRRLKEAEQVIIICTETYRNRVEGEEEKGKGKGVKWESTLTYQYIYDDDSQNTRFIPVVFDMDDCQYIPTPLKGANFYCVKTQEGYVSLYRRLTNQPKIEKPELGQKIKLPPEKVAEDFTSDASGHALDVSLYKLPVTGDRLFGREKELKLLDEAWTEHHTHILTLVAWGGVGKTALVNQWLNQMETDNYRGAQKVFGWSFYSQGAECGRDVAMVRRCPPRSRVRRGQGTPPGPSGAATKVPAHPGRVRTPAISAGRIKGFGWEIERRRPGRLFKRTGRGKSRRRQHTEGVVCHHHAGTRDRSSESQRIRG